MFCDKVSDAKNMSEQANSNVPLWFCPQINNYCNDKCLCFRKARAVGHYYYEAYCTHQLLQETMHTHVEIEGGYR